MAMQRQARPRGADAPAAGPGHPRLADHPLWHSPRQTAQRLAINASFGPAAAVVQRVPAGRYVTTEDGNLRDANKAVLRNVPQGTEARVHPGAPTETFKLPGVSWPKAHTWTQVYNQYGWLKDSVLGKAQPEIQPARDQDQDQDRGLPTLTRVPRATQPAPTRSAPVGMGGSSGGGLTHAGPPAHVSAEELDAYRLAAEEQLEYPGTDPRVEPLGAGSPSKLDKANFVIRIHGGQLHEHTGQRALTVRKSPFVLGTDGVLYGGQGPSQGGDLRYEIMGKHGDAEVAFPAWAGELAVANGQVTHIDNESGTFKLKDEANINLIKYLYRRNVLTLNQISRLDVQRVASWGIDRGHSTLATHQVLAE